MQEPQTRPLLLHLTLLLSGACVMVLEILGTRVLSPLFGSGLQVWAALITVTLAALALGYWSGGTLADRRPSPTLFFGLVLLAGVAALAVRVLALPVLEACAGLGLAGGALASAAVLFGPALWLLGSLTPFACRLHPQHARRTGGTVGRLYAVSTAGSVAGALAAGFLLLPLVPLGRIFLVAGLALCGLAAVGLFAARRPPAALAALAIAALGPLPHSAPRPPAAVEILRDEQSFHHRIQTVDAFGERFLLLDGVVHTHLSLLHPDDPVRCEYARTAELVPILRPASRRFLLIGCGGGAMLRLLEAPGRTFDVLDLDPGVVRAAREDFGAGVEGATFHIEDGRRFLRRGGTWDAILLDVVSTDAMPEHLCSREFLEEARGHLVPGGLLFMNSVGAPGGIVLASLERTLHAVFRHVLAFTAHDEEIATNVLWIGSETPLRLPDDVARVYADRVYRGGAGGTVLRDDFNPINAWNAELGLELRRRLQARLGTALWLPR